MPCFRFQQIILLLILFTLFGASPLLAATSSYKALPKTETASLFRIIHNYLREEQIMAFSRKADPSEQGATAMTMYAAYQETIQFYFQELPQTISKKILLEAIKLGYHLLDSSNITYTFLDTLEDLSVKRANQIAKDWLTANNLQAAGGEISFSYLDYENQDQTSNLQYIVLYYPKTENSGKLIAAFYSPEPIIPSRARASIPWPYEAWRQAGHQKLSPFIVEIEGQVEKRYSAYSWKKPPTFSVVFPSLVPRFSFQEKSSSLFAPLGWIKDQVVNFFSSSPEEIVISPQDNSSTEIEELRKTVQSLKEVVEKKSVSEAPPEKETNSSIELAEVIKELANSFSDQSEEESELIGLLKEVSQTQAKIAQIQSKSTIIEENPSEEKEEDSLAVKISQPIEENFCPTENLPQPTWNKVIFNEIAWMGTSHSSNNEWIELKNISSQDINLEGWQIFNQTQHLTLRFNKKDSISPQDFFLLERSDDQSLPGQVANKIYQGAIKNSEEKLYLFDQNCQLQDIAAAKTDWPAGDNNSKRTMERKESLAWQTSYSIGGTPNKRNSRGWQPSPSKTENPSTNSTAEETVSPNPVSVDHYPPLAIAGPDQTLTYGQIIQLDASQSGDNLGIVSYKWDTSQDGLWNFVQSNPVLELEGDLSPGEYTFTLEVADAAGQTDQDKITITILEIPKILISEIQIEGKNSQDEFIELFNPQDKEISLTDWKLTKKTAAGNEASLVNSQSFVGSIPPQGYFLVTPSSTDAEHGYRGEALPDLYYSNTSTSLAENNTLILYNPLEQVADKVGFGQEVTDFEGEAFPENPEAGFSLGRFWNEEAQKYQDSDNNQEDFLLNIPSPKAQNQPYLGPTFPEVDFYLSDLETGSPTITTQQEVKVNIFNDEGAVAWLLTSDPEFIPEKENSQWLTVKPNNFILSSANGEKTLFLWLKDQNGILSSQYSASIILSQNPPQAIYDLSLYPTKTNGEILLTWTAPQTEDEKAVSQYIIKQSSSPITEDEWETAIPVSQELVPQSPGSSERLIISDLNSAQTYYFALKSKGEGTILSPISNSPSRQAIAASGTLNDPYIVTNCQELQEIKLNLNAFYQLANDIDCSATKDWNNQQGFEPLGKSSSPFTGSLDGQNFTIDNLHINRTGNNQRDIGLIGMARADAQILNLGLRNADIRGYKYVGGLIGRAQGFSNDPLPMIIENCYTTGYLASSNQGEGDIGGLVGLGSNTRIDRSWSSMEIEASQADCVGGLIGKAFIKGEIISSHYQGNVRGHQEVGGLAGNLEGLTVKKCFSKGKVEGDKVGGLIGKANGPVENSYSQANISASGNFAGGFAAQTFSLAIITNSYSTGYLQNSGLSSAGFLGESKNSQQMNCYWDVQASGQSRSQGTASGLTTEQMQNQASFGGWDFANVWTIEEGNYPSLQE